MRQVGAAQLKPFLLEAWRAHLMSSSCLSSRLQLIVIFCVGNGQVAGRV
jgi:hypothetical protein